MNKFILVSLAILALALPCYAGKDRVKELQQEAQKLLEEVQQLSAQQQTLEQEKQKRQIRLIEIQGILKEFASEKEPTKK